MKKMYSRRVSPRFQNMIKTTAELLGVTETVALEIAITQCLANCLTVLSGQRNETRVMTRPSTHKGQYK